MKRIILLLLTALSLTAGAQVYNNEWIDYNKTYYKFKVGATGLYRITQPMLNSLGIGNVNVDHFQLWRNGQEVPLYTSVQGVALGASDYLEFYGEMNDGKPDKALYRESDFQLNDKWSLQTDTASFFLTVNPAGSNSRLVNTSNNVVGNTIPAEPYFMHRFLNSYKIKINLGRSELVGSSYTYSSSYDSGEGWTSDDIVTGASRSFFFSNLRAYTGAGAPTGLLKINAAGNAVNPRKIRVRLNGDSIYSQNMDYYDYAKASIPINVSQLSTGQAIVEVANMCASPSDRMVVASYELIYPRLFNFGGTSNFYFELPANNTGNFLQITGFNFGGTAPVLYDLTNGKRYLGDISNPAMVKLVLQASSIDRKLVLLSAAPTNIKPITSIEARTFNNYGLAANQGDFLIISNALLTGVTGGDDPVDDYREYRSSPQGGSYNAKVYLMDQLEDQFGFGIKLHPMSVRNFLRWARATYSSPLKSVFLIGKGVIYPLVNSHLGNPDLDRLCLVPTFGNPASDNLLSAEGNSSIPITPIGRLSVINKSEITTYLDKVKEYEQAQTIASPSIEDKAWMKNIVHVTGASDNNTSDILLAALNGHKQIIEDTLYAGNVSTFTKFSADAVEQVASTRLENLFRQGVGLLTYFGHSSASTLEFNLDNPDSYDNKGKYPVFIVMGCNAGSFYNFNNARFTSKETISEKFVLAKDRGSIAFLASTHLGIVHYLDIYNSRNYRAMSTVKYGATLGEIMDEAIREVFALTTENDFYARFQCEQFTLHGDPAIKYYHFDKPDYVIEDPLVKVTPSFIPVSAAQFTVNAAFMNIGKAVTRDVIVEIKRTYPDQSTEIIYRDTLPFTKYMDSISYDVRIVPTRDKGLNKITVTVDAGNEVDELYETNNSITKEVYIIEDDVKPVYPYNYSIVGQQDVKLVASTADPFAKARDYWVEIDTTELFNSPLKVTRTINSSGGVFEVNPGISLLDSTVYYWRVAAVVATGIPGWNSSSFEYIANSSAGFSQAHHYQFLKNSYNKIEYDESRKFKFSPKIYDISVATGIYPYASQTSQFRLSIDGSTVQAGLYGPLNSNRNVLRFYVVDGKTFIPWKNISTGTAGLYGSTNPTPINSTVAPGFFQFDISTTAARVNVMNFIDLIPQGDYLIMTNSPYSTTVLPSVWMNDTTSLGSGNSLYHKVFNLGFSNLPTMTSYVPFVFAAQKGNPVAIKQVISPSAPEDLHTSFALTGRNFTGSYISETFGPAKSWGTLHWKGRFEEPGSPDDVELQVLGIKSDGSIDTLVAVNTPGESVPVDFIDAAVYPKLKFRMAVSDPVNYTPYQLDYWMLTYDPVPEGAIAPNLYFQEKDSVGVGEQVNFGIAFKNVSKSNFDSVKVRVVVTDKNNVEKIIFDGRQKPLVAGDTIKLNVPIDTKLLGGQNTLFVNFNPDNDQPEQYLFNNYAFRNLYVRPDSLNPVMDVTFDGTHILNKDIISAKPHILVKLSDEMKGMELNDTSLVTVSVRYPDGNSRRFYFNDNVDTLQFISANPAAGSENTATVNFKPYFSEDGEYELIVTGKDRSGNLAGRTEYRVSFMVINKPMISNMLNYPNPFTTSTAFVFTVTGSEVPQNIRIQVLTITGKIVREITKEELGPLHIGRNITEFKWDGTDQYGQKLANGIYLYRVITNLNGKALDKYKAQGDDTDKYFNKGYGKMYLMR